MKKILLWAIAVLGLLLLLLGSGMAWLLTPSGQQFVTQQVRGYLHKKLGTPVQINKIGYKIPDWIRLEKLYLEDQQGDTLLAVRSLYVNLDMLQLLQGNVALNVIELDGLRAHVQRSLPDTTFNFQYILDAFVPPSTEPAPPDTGDPLLMHLDRLTLTDSRLRYDDVVVGIRSELNIQQATATFEAFNPGINRYHLKALNWRGGYLNAQLSTPLPVAPSAPTASAASDSLDLRLGTILLQELGITYADPSGGLASTARIGTLRLDGERVYLEGQQLAFKHFGLSDSDIALTLSPTTPSAPPSSDSSDEPSNWKVSLGQLGLRNNSLRYDDTSAPVAAKGFDAGHVNFTRLTADLKNLYHDTHVTQGQLTRLSFREKSGLDLRQLRADFGHSPTETYLRGLQIQTPRSSLRTDLTLRHRSAKALTEELAQVGINLALAESQVSFEEVLQLFPDLATTPPFKSHPTALLKGKALLSGTVGDLQIRGADFSGIGQTTLRIGGQVRGLPDTDRLALNLRLQELSTSRADLMRLLPDSLLPASLTLPEQLSLRGEVIGSLQDKLRVDALLTTSLGDASLKADLQNPTEPERIRYSGTLGLHDFALGTFLQRPAEEVGKVSLVAEVEGQGTDPSTLYTKWNGKVQSLQLNGYDYRNLATRGSMQQGRLTLTASLADPNIQLSLDSQADLNLAYPSVKSTLRLDHLDLGPLGLSDSAMQIKGIAVLDFRSTNPSNPLGELRLREVMLQRPDQSATLDDFRVQLDSTSQGRSLRIEAPFMQALLNGQYSYEQLADVLLSEINKYFTLPGLPGSTPTTAYDFGLNATLRQHPFLTFFAPQLTHMQPVELSARLSEQSPTLVGSLRVPEVVYDSIHISRFNLDLKGDGQRAVLLGTLDELRVKEAFRMRRANLQSTVADDLMRLSFEVKDSLDQPRHGLVSQLAYVDSTFRLWLDSPLLLDYKPWQADTSGMIVYSKRGLEIPRFSIETDGQRLLIASAEKSPNAPLRIVTENIRLAPLVSIVTQDTTLLSGLLNGDILVRDYTTTPVFTGDLTVSDLVVTQVPIGTLEFDATNEKPDRISIEASLRSPDNRVNVVGDYLLDAPKPLDFTIDVGRLSAQTIGAFSQGYLLNTQGSISGKTTLQGSVEDPFMKGEMRFDSMALTAGPLGGRFFLDNQRILLNGPRLLFRNFILKDALDQALTLNGTVSVANLPKAVYDLRLSATDFTLLNATRKDNDYFYGKGIVSSNLTIKGIGTQTAIEGSVKLRPGSDISILLPDYTSGAEATEGIVRFVDRATPTQENPLRTDDPTAVNVDFVSEISLNIEADDRSQLTIVMDELNGDNIKVKGNAQLNTGITPNGQLYLLGLYELTEGAYDLTLEVLKRQFTIEKGSTLLWTGDPMKAEIDITAVYTVSADLAALGEAGARYGKLPLDVLLKIQGNLTAPIIDFDLRAASTVPRETATGIDNDRVFDELRNNRANMNKQVFALLVLNNFLTDQSSGALSNANPEAMARQSVSQLLSDQLNTLASDLIKGVNLNFDLNSSLEGASARTDLSVGLSKAFLNDRLTIAVGRNFEIESGNRTEHSTELFDNVSVNYALSKDNRYMFRAYRKNQFQSVLEVFVVETGVSLIMNLDYDKVAEIFRKATP